MKLRWRIRREYRGYFNAALDSWATWCVYPPFMGSDPYVFPTWREAIDFVTTGLVLR